MITNLLDALDIVSRRQIMVPGTRGSHLTFLGVPHADLLFSQEFTARRKYVFHALLKILPPEILFRDDESPSRERR